ncbi:MAG: hypothetical protein WC595_04200 [Candidatus Nanoarchaeia archaeon]
MKKIKFRWISLFWLGIAIIILWFLARALGLFHTPLIIEAIPYVAALISLLGVAKEIGRFFQRFEGVVSDLTGIKLELKGIRAELHSLDKRVSIVEMKL